MLSKVVADTLLVALSSDRMASPRPPRYVQAEAKVSGGEHADDFHYKGLVIEAQSYKSDGDSVADPKRS